MRESRLKILFYVLAFLMLAALLIIRRDAGISGDEKVHYEHSEKVYDYYATMGKDQDALNTPKTHLQYYGQLPDNLATILIHWFKIDDIYGFRHLFSSFLGWLAIFITAMFTRWIKGYTAAIITLLLFAVSPVFLGHLQNNLKDIPFALAYIAGVYFILKLSYINFKPGKSTMVILLILSIAFSVGIRAGGILLIIYLFFAVFLYYAIDYYYKRRLKQKQLTRTLLLASIIAVAGYFCGIILWPYALVNPFVNPFKSLVLMTNFTTTIQQIFEGKFIWSDFHPWYYLPKYMLITIPIIVWLGVLLFIFLSNSIIEPKFRLTIFFLIFTLVFPILFVILRKSNLYGSWRHFLFLYPAIIILASLGINELILRIKRISPKVIAIAVLLALTIHPLRFMAASHPYYYLYYNQLIGGLKGAYGKYETDYYYHTLKSGADWLKSYLIEKEKTGEIIVGSNFPVEWYFKDSNNINCTYFKYYSREDVNWDYAIIANSYIEPNTLLNGNFPPEGTIHQVLIEGVPVCVVVERKTKLAFQAAQYFDNEEYEASINCYEEALKYYQNDEHIYYKLGKSLNLLGKNEEAQEVLSHSLQINPNYEPALDLQGVIFEGKGDTEAARQNFIKLIDTNKKYYIAYVELAKIYQQEGNLELARETLKKCLLISPSYTPAIAAMASTYEDTNPDIAHKYIELSNSIKKLN